MLLHPAPGNRSAPPALLAACWSRVRAIRKLLGRPDVSTTMVCTHFLTRDPGAVRSPADRLLSPGGTGGDPLPATFPGELDCEKLQPNAATPRSPRPANNVQT